MTGCNECDMYLGVPGLVNTKKGDTVQSTKRRLSHNGFCFILFYCCDGNF